MNHNQSSTPTTSYGITTFGLVVKPKQILARLKVYLRVWSMTAGNAWQLFFINRWSNSLFFFGKAIRLIMALTFLGLLKQRQIGLVGYTSDQVLVFYLTYQLVDVISQTLYRGVYNFSTLIRSGNFDFLLTRPINPLFRALTGEPDIDDFFFLFPTLAITIYLLSALNLNLSWSAICLYLVLLINSILIATGLHIMVLVMGILTTEVDNIIWIYRDLSRLGQFPVTIYLEPVRSILFLLIPIGLMITVPAQVLIGAQPSYSASLASLIGIGFFLLSLKLWNWSLKQYSSASS